MHEAANWVLELQGGELSVAERKRFACWLRESPANVREYLELAGLWKELEVYDVDHRIDVDALLGESNVVPLASSQSTVRKLSPPMNRRRWTYWAAAGIAALAVAAGGLFVSRVGSTPDDNLFATRVGEQRSVALEDGSVVHLNTASAAIIVVTETQRYVELRSGEAYFTVAKDPDRPFVVRAGDTEVRALGTQFNVRRQASLATVTVVEGRVAVSQTGSAALAPSKKTGAEGPTLELSAGQQVSVGSAVGSARTEDVKAEKVVAWTERRLVFEGETLADIVAEFNRYNFNRLEVNDPAIASIRLSAVFGSNDPESLLEYLSTMDVVDIERRADGTRVIRAARVPQER